MMINIKKLLNSKRIEVSFIEIDISKGFVKRFRSNKNLTQTALANIMGVSKLTINLWECGFKKVKGSSAVLFKLLNDNPYLMNQLYKVELAGDE